MPSCARSKRNRVARDLDPEPAAASCPRAATPRRPARAQLGEPPKFDFERAAWEIATNLGLLDFERGRDRGSGFLLFTGSAPSSSAPDRFHARLPRRAARVPRGVAADLVRAAHCSARPAAELEGDMYCRRGRPVPHRRPNAGHEHLPRRIVNRDAAHLHAPTALVPAEAGAADENARHGPRPPVHKVDWSDRSPETATTSTRSARDVCDIFEALELPYRGAVCSGDLSFAATMHDFEVSPGPGAARGSRAPLGTSRRAAGQCASGGEEGRPAESAHAERVGRWRAHLRTSSRTTRPWTRVRIPRRCVLPRRSSGIRPGGS